MFDEPTQYCGPQQRQWLCRVVDRATDNETVLDIAKWLSPWVMIALILVGAYVATRVMRLLVRRSVRRWERKGSADGPERRHARAQTIASGIASFASIVIWVVAGVWVLSMLGINTATLLTSAGLIGVALAFGAQNLLRDLIAGTFMIFEDQLGVGDVVDLGVASGTVEEVTLRTTRLRDAAGVAWYVPNGVIQRVGNSSMNWARAVVDVPLSQSADLSRAREVIADASAAMREDEQWREVMLAPPEVLGVEAFTLDTVTVRVVAKTAPAAQWRVARELRARIKGALDAAGIVSNPWANIAGPPGVHGPSAGGPEPGTPG